MANSSEPDWVDRASRVVCRPVFVCAVLVLMINDHLLKGAGWLPGVITGKLSDVVGLFFFPVLLAVVAVAVLGPETFREVRRISVGAVVATIAVFSAVNLSPTLAGVLSDTWGVWTADPTDLLCLPFAVVGHLWFLGRVAVEQGPDPGRVTRYAVILVAAGASIATSLQTATPEAELLNETDSSLEFVETDAQIVYHAETESLPRPIVRARVDGTGETEITSEDYALRSMSLGGDAKVLRTVDVDDGSQTLYLYREGEADFHEISTVEKPMGRPLVSPGGRFVAFASASDPGSEVETIELYDVETRSADVIREDVGIGVVDFEIEWARDGSVLYANVDGQGRMAYEFASDSWTDSTEDVDENDLYRAVDPTPRRCEGEEGEWRLKDPARGGGFEDYEGLKLVDPEGDSEVLVELEILEDIEDPDDYRPPISHYQFVGDCNHVVFTLDDEKPVWIVEVDSKTAGSISDGRVSRPVVVPEDRP